MRLFGDEHSGYAAKKIESHAQDCAWGCCQRAGCACVGTCGAGRRVLDMLREREFSVANFSLSENGTCRVGTNLVRSTYIF